MNRRFRRSSCRCLRAQLCSAAGVFSDTVLAGSCQSHWGHDYGEPLGHGLEGTAQASSSARGSGADRRAALYGTCRVTRRVAGDVAGLARRHLALSLNPSPQAILVAMRRSLRRAMQRSRTTAFQLPPQRNVPSARDMRLCTSASSAILSAFYGTTVPPHVLQASATVT